MPIEGLDDPSSVRPNASPTGTTVYYILVTDENGDFIGEDNVEVTVDNSVSNLRLESQFQEICSDGASIISIKNIFDDNYQFSWSTTEETEEIAITTAGTYSVTATNSDTGCSVVLEESIESTEFSVMLNASGTTVCGNTPVAIEAVPLPNTSVYFYNWSTLSTEPIINVVEQGEYSVTVTNPENGCVASNSINISSDFAINITPESPIICDEGETFTTLSAQDGFSSYRWESNGQLIGSTSSIEVTYGGEYLLTVINIDGCEISKMIEVNALSSNNLTIIASGDGICIGDPGFTSSSTTRIIGSSCNESIVLTAPDGFSNYTWSNGLSGQEIEVTTLGNYSVNLEADGACIYELSYEVTPCLSSSNDFFPDLPLSLCSTGSSVNIGGSNETLSYVWSTGDINSNIDVDIPDDYFLTITDGNGCTTEKSFSIMPPIDNDASIEIELYRPMSMPNDPGGIYAAPYSTGGMVFENFNNDDGDRWLDFDIDDDEISSASINSDPDFMKVRLKLIPGTSGMVHTVKLEGEDADNDGDLGINLWLSSDKSAGKYELGSLLTFSSQENGIYYMDLWAEGTNKNSTQQGVKLKLTCNTNPDCSIEREAFITVVGMEGLEWTGQNNGYSIPSFDSPVLDTNDPLFSQSLNFDETSVLSQRVFPGSRTNNDNIVGSPRNKVNLTATISPAPIESIKIYLRTFDIDDPSSDTNFIDPNDKRNCCSSGVPQYKGTSGRFYTANNDNRGFVNGQVYGFLNGQDGMGIVELAFSANQMSQIIEYETSLSPGDNYRVVASFSRSFINSLRNLDAKDDFHIVDSEVRKDKGSIAFAGRYASNVLTVWRILHVEDDSMRDYQPSENQNVAAFALLDDPTVNQMLFEDFEGIGNRFSRLSKIMNFVVENSLTEEPLHFLDGSLNLDDSTVGGVTAP